MGVPVLIAEFFSAFFHSVASVLTHPVVSGSISLFLGCVVFCALIFELSTLFERFEDLFAFIFGVSVFLSFALIVGFFAWSLKYYGA